MPEVIDWDAFEKWEKGRPSFRIPDGRVNISKSRLNLKRFMEHFDRYVDIYYQEDYLLVVPTEDASARTIGRGSVHVERFVREHPGVMGIHPAEWIDGHGLLIDLREKKVGLGEVLG